MGEVKFVKTRLYWSRWVLNPIGLLCSSEEKEKKKREKKKRWRQRQRHRMSHGDRTEIGVMTIQRTSSIAGICEKLGDRHEQMLPLSPHSGTFISDF